MEQKDLKIKYLPQFQLNFHVWNDNILYIWMQLIPIKNFKNQTRNIKTRGNLKKTLLFISGFSILSVFWTPWKMVPWATASFYTALLLSWCRAILWNFNNAPISHLLYYRSNLLTIWFIVFFEIWLHSHLTFKNHPAGKVNFWTTVSYYIVPSCNTDL